MSPAPSGLSPAKITAFFTRLKQERPHPTTELEFTSPFTLLVAVVLAAQATDKGVNKATRPLFAVADTPQKMLALGEEGVKGYVKSINFFNNKTRNILALCRKLVEEHGGQVPPDRGALEGLPGVGRKSANVILNVCFEEPVIAVDTHIFRVANRTGLAPGNTPLEVEDALMVATPREFLHDAHHWLVLHGRYICKARTPDCPHCPVQDLCLFPDKTWD